MNKKCKICKNKSNNGMKNIYKWKILGYKMNQNA